MLFSSRRAPLAYALFFTVLLASAAVIARWDEAADRVTFDALTPLVMTASNVGTLLVANVRALVIVAASSVVVFACVALYCRQPAVGGRRGQAALLGVLVFAIAAEVSFLWDLPAVGLALVAVALVLAMFSEEHHEHDRGQRTFGWIDFGVLGAITLLAFVVRLFALNRLPANFEGELSPYYLGATTLSGIVPANAGTAGPWSPLGFLFYVPIFLSIQFFGATVLAIRFSTAAVSLATLPLLYYFALTTFGRTAAIVATTFFVVDPLQIGWGRTDVHPHGVTTWPVVLIAFVTFRAFTTGGARYLVLLAALMALCWHQYPSGQLAVIIPFVVLAIMLIRRERVRRLGTTLAALTCGLVLWVSGVVLVGSSGGSVAGYIEQLGPRVAWNQTADESVLGQRLQSATGGAVKLTRDLVAGVFLELPYRFHQDILVEIPGLPTRSTPWIVAALVIAAVCLMVTRPLTPRDYVMIAWVVAAAAPAVFSDRAYPKRASTLFPALFVVAAFAADRFLHLLRDAPRAIRVALAASLSVAVAAWVCVTASLWFSGMWLSYGKPGEAALAERIVPRLTPGTIVIADIWENYAQGKMSYVLNDGLIAPERQPLFWYIVDPQRDVRALIADPTLALEYSAPDRFYYVWSTIGKRRAEALAERDWLQAMFLFQTGLDSAETLRHVRTAHPFPYTDAERLEMLQRREPRCEIEEFPAENCDLCGYIVARCPLRPTS